MQALSQSFVSLKNMTTREDSIAILRKIGVTPSPQRTAIYHFLRTHAIHPTAETIFAAVRTEQPSLSLTTVYNTLKLLVEKRAVREIIIEGGELRYDADMTEHGHFKCLHCGDVYDLFPPDGVPLVPSVPGLPDDFVLKEIQLCCRGYCPKEACRAAICAART